jgi:hypothetical protein
MGEEQSARPASGNNGEDNGRRDAAEHGDGHILERKDTFVGQGRLPVAARGSRGTIEWDRETRGLRRWLSFLDSGASSTGQASAPGSRQPPAGRFLCRKLFHRGFLHGVMESPSGRRVQKPRPRRAFAGLK